MPSEEEKIHQLEKRIVQLEQALQEKEAANTTQNQTPPVSSASPQATAMPNRPPQPSIPPQVSPFQTVPPPYVSPAPPQSEKPMDMEQKFGRTVMGILASVFVFAAILIGYAFLPGWMQAVGLYIIGIAVSAIGLYLSLIHI